MHEIADIDVYLQVARESTGGWSQREILNNIPLARKHYTAQIIENIIRDGWYEGLSLGYPAVYSPKEKHRPFVPYGCWFRRSEETGIFVNLGTSILIEDRFHLYKQYQVTDDTYFCSKAMSLGYTSFQLQVGRKDAETVVCYGDCGRIPFNTTCPPGMKLRKGYQAYNDTCNCSDENILLNCDGNLVIDMKKPSVLDNNKCIMTINDLTSTQMYTNHVLDMMLYFTTDLLSTSKSSHDRDQLLLSSLTSSIGRITDITKTLVLNLETNASKDSISGLFRLKDGQINTSFLLTESVPLYSMTLDIHMTERKLINIDNKYIGVISNFRYANPAGHRRWLLDDARCLKKLGAYLIILVGNFDHGVVEWLMGFLHSYVDLIIGVDDRAQSIKSSFYLHYHKKTDLNDYDKMLNRMLMFEKSPNAFKNYGRIHIQKMPDYKLMINRTTVSTI